MKKPGIPIIGYEPTKATTFGNYFNNEKRSRFHN